MDQSRTETIPPESPRSTTGTLKPSSGTIEVAIGTSLTAELIERIALLDPRLHVRDVASHFVNELPEALRPGQSPPRSSAEPDFPAVLRATEVLLAPRQMPSDILARMPSLRWAQAVTAGVDYLANTGVAGNGVCLTTAAGINTRPVAEYAMAGILYFAKELDRVRRNQRAHRWERHDLGELGGRTLGLLGLGAVGSQVAHLAAAFGMHVLAMRRSNGIAQSGVHEVWGMERLDELLSRADYVVVALPLTSSTRAVIDEGRLLSMSPHAVLVNVGRGPVVDEAALLKALQSAWIRGAVLDVFEQEPLPADHPFWEMENVLLSAHLAGLSDRYDARVVDVFCDNLSRYLEGLPLLNVVDASHGY